MTEPIAAPAAVAAPGAPDEDEPIAPAAPVAAATEQRRGLKLVVTLEPAGDGYQALLAVAADGCDPSFHSLEVDELAAALDEVPALVADAEARWQQQPRYPALGPAPRAPKAAGARAAPPVAPATGLTAAGAPAPKPAPAGQLDLFA